MAFQLNTNSTAPAATTLPDSRRRRLTAAAGMAAAAAAAGAMMLGVAFAGPASASTAAPATASASASPASLTVGIADPDLIRETAAVQASQLTAMKAIGITSIRLDANWDWVEYGGQGTYDWSMLDQVVESVRAAGMSVDLIIDGCPPWAATAGTAGDASPQPASSGKYADFAAAVAARYAPEGVNIFEIWNEPNLQGSWQPKPNPAAYTAILVQASKAIRKVDPAAFIISGGLAPAVSNGTDISPTDFLADMYADGAKGSFNAVGYHPYSYPAMPNTYEAWSGWSQMSQTSPSIRSIMTSHGDSSIPVWITEVGAPSSGPDGVGVTAQANEFTQAITDAQNTSWVGGLYLYSWQDEGTDQTNNEDWFGLLTAAGAQKPAYTAVQNALQ